MAKSIKTIAKQVASRHKRKKEAATALEKARDEFFAYATEQVDDPDLLARKTVQTTNGLLAGLVQVAKDYPEWRVLTSEQEDADDPHTWNHLLEENPKFKSYVYADPDLGLVFERQFRSGKIVLDDERLKKENPELYDEVMEMVPQPKDFDKLDDETLADVQQYVYREKPTVALASPRKAKEEDYEDGD